MSLSLGDVRLEVCKERFGAAGTALSVSGGDGSLGCVGDGGFGSFIRSEFGCDVAWEVGWCGGSGSGERLHVPDVGILGLWGSITRKFLVRNTKNLIWNGQEVGLTETGALYAFNSRT